MPFVHCSGHGESPQRTHHQHLLHFRQESLAGWRIYAASKWGLNGLSFSLAEELRAHNVRVSVVRPGSVNTELSDHEGRDLSRMLTPAHVAHAVAMLVTQRPQSFISEIVLRPTQKP